MIKTFHTKLLLGLILCLTVIAYIPALKAGFTNWDDLKYLINNPLVKDLSLSGIGQMFSTFVIVNHHYHPLTLLGWAIEYHFFGLEPFVYHLNNVLLHLVNVVLVFLFAQRLTRKDFIALLTAGLFALHPMHVESVAWIVERKDVQYSLFYLLALITYLKHVESLKLKRKKYYFGTLLLFLLACLSKPMAITLPLVIILLDFYKARAITKSALFEKINFLFISFAFGIIAMAQKPSGDFVNLNEFSFIERIFLSAYAFITYLWKLILPVQLINFYPLPERINGQLPLIYYISLAITLCTLYGFWRLSKRVPIVRFGVCFFLATIFLVIGFVKIGDAVLAERYTYLPYIGLFLIIGHYVNNLYNRFAAKRHFIIALCCIVLLIFASESYVRAKVWNNSYALWTDALKKNPELVSGYNNRGTFLGRIKKFDEALYDFNQALHLNPNYARSYNNRAIVYISKEEYALAVKDLNTAIELKPDYKVAYFHRGFAYEQLRQYELALQDYAIVLKLDPGFFEADERKKIVQQKIIDE